MAVAKTNGLNGHTNGHANGTTKSPKTNGRAAGPITKRSPRARAGPGIFARLFSITARLFTWYSIITVLFRCPSTLEACNESTPQICGPYFQAKNAVSPHLSPYYNTYAAPYVDLAKPYYEVVDRTVIAPGRNYAVKYAGPRVTQAQAYGKAQWEKSVQPQIVKYQGLAKGHYDQTLAPHVNTASEALAPYYSIAKTNALQTYHEVVSPAYVAVAPYAIQGYNTAHNFAITTALPSGLWAWHKTNKFLDTTVWPHVHDIYAAKVEPQLNRIGERLGRYNDKKARPTAVTEDTVVSSIASSFAKPSASVSSAASVASESVASIASKIVSEVTSLAATEKPMETVAAAARAVEDAVVPDQNEDARDSAARIVQDDLDMWEGKFTKVAEEGASEIEDRIEQVAARMIEQDLNPVGRQTTVKLYNTILQEMSRLHAGIRKSLEANVGNMDKLDEDVLGLLRQTGLPIKNAAQEVRQWRQNFDQELEAQVTLVVQEHFAILEETRDLAISKIGMKWAWMDGVTYKDWQKYHELKDKFRDWINDLKRLIVEHPALLEAQQQAAVIDEEAMAIAEHAVKDLMKLKDIARYKAIAGDFSDNFLEEEMELAALRAEKKRATEAKEAARAETARAEAARAADAAKEAAAHGTESVASVAAAATEALKDTIVNAGSDARKSSGHAAEDVTDTETSAVPPLDSLTEEPTESATDLAPDATNEAEPYETLAGEELALEDGPEQVVEEIVEESEQPLPPPATTPEVKSAWLGAAAQAVPSRQPIIDDEYLESAQSAASVIQSDVPASITSAAQAAYTAAIAQAANQYSKALSVVSVQISGEPKPLQEQMYSSVSNAYFAALATANAGLNSALTAASEGVYGTPTSRWMPAMPTVPSVDWERVQSIAQQNLDDSLGWANKQYEAAKVAAAEQVEAAKVAVGAAEPSPSTYLEAAQKRAQKIQEQAQHNYYAGMGVAYARYSEFLAAASTAVSSLTATPTPTNIQGSASSVASVASASAASAASLATGSAASVASIASASAASAASVASGAAISVASDASQLASDAAETVGETWDSLVSAVSSQVYGAPVPTPWYENLYATAGDYAAAAGAYAAAATDAAGQQYSQAAEVVGDYASSAGDYAASATNAAGEQLSQVTNVVNDYAVSASSAADVQYSAVSSLVSELIIGKEPTFTESVYSRLAGAYDFGLATAASIASVASETIMSAASEVTESASSVISVVEETVASATEKVKETIESVRDEL